MYFKYMEVGFNLGRVIVVEPNGTDEDKVRHMNELREVLKQIAASLSEEQLEHLDKLNKSTKAIEAKEIIRC